MAETTTDAGTGAAPLGDALPAPLERYFAAIDEHRFADAAAAFGDDGRYAVPRPGGIETDPRTETVGRRDLHARLVDRGPKPWRHRITLGFVDGRDALVEGVLVGDAGAPVATFVASATVGRESIERYLAFSCGGALAPVPTDVDPEASPADAVDVLQAYFSALDEGRFADAAACFSTDTHYSHPPYRHTGIDGPDRVEFRGRPALRAAFEARGRTSFDHEILAGIQRGPHCMIEGAVGGLPEDRTGSFVSSLSLAADGTIRRYVTFYCEPGVPTVP